MGPALMARPIVRQEGELRAPTTSVPGPPRFHLRAAGRRGAARREEPCTNSRRSPRHPGGGGHAVVRPADCRGRELRERSAEPRALALRIAGALGAVDPVHARRSRSAARGLAPQWLGGAAVTASYVAAVAAIFHAVQGLGAWARTSGACDLC